MVRIKQKTAHVVYTPLSYEFEMQIIGGSTDQVYDNLNKQYQPDRTLVPLVLNPKLFVVDPDKVISSGVMTQFLTNVRWTLVKYNPVTKTKEFLMPSVSTYQVRDKSVFVFCNVQLGSTVEVGFSAQYVDPRRGETANFTWHATLVSSVQEIWRPSIYIDAPSKMLLSPFKNKELIEIPAVFRNGDKEMKAASYSWECLVDGNWVALSNAQKSLEHPPLAVDYDTVSKSTLVLKQDLVQDMCVRCVAYGKKLTETSKVVSKVVRLRRSYGQYEDRMDILEGQIMKPGQKRSSVNIVVTRRKELVTNPVRYFAIDIFHAVDDKELKLMTNNATFTLQGNDLTKNEQKFGYAVREKSASIPVLSPEGKYLAVGGKILVGHFPVTTIEY